MHAGCPDCAETMKWSTPAFDYKGARIVASAISVNRRPPSKTEMTGLIHKAMALNDDGERKSRNWKYHEPFDKKTQPRRHEGAKKTLQLL